MHAQTDSGLDINSQTYTGIIVAVYVIYLWLELLWLWLSNNNVLSSCSHSFLELLSSRKSQWACLFLRLNYHVFYFSYRCSACSTCTCLHHASCFASRNLLLIGFSKTALLNPLTRGRKIYTIKNYWIFFSVCTLVFLSWTHKLIKLLKKKCKIESLGIWSDASLSQKERSAAKQKSKLIIFSSLPAV